MAYNPASEAKFTFEILDFDYDLSVVGFDVTETVSDTYVVNLELASKDTIKFDDVKLEEGLLTVVGGTGASILDESGDRYFHGIIRKFKHSGTSGKLKLYEAQIVPSHWLLSLKTDCRLFQDTKLTDIITKLFQEQDISSESYEFRLDRDDIFIKFSMQYQETNLNYLDRILDHEGIFYFFEHHKDKHVMVFCDTEAYYQEITEQSSIPFSTNGMVAEKENVFAFGISERLRPGAHAHTNYNFKTPSTDLSAGNKGKTEKDFEVYEYPGGHGEKNDGDELSKIRLEELQALAKQGEGESCCPRFQAGATFTLTDHPHDDFNDEYFFYEVTHEGEQPQVLEEQGAGASSSYSNSFTVIPATVVYRPVRHKKPTVPGLLSAVVTGPENEEIWPDEFGRVNVQFHFDREGKKNEQSSCWIRTIEFWNGGSYGSQFIPRVGDEVLVSFVDGDMDYPIIMGCAINEAKQPNYNLPANKTQSGIKTMSTPGGGPNNFNELRFEDLKGKEEVYLQAEKNFNSLVKNNTTETILVAKALSIGAGYQVSVGAEMNETVGGAKTEEVGLYRMEAVGGDNSIKVGGNYSLNVSGGGTSKSESFTMTADTNITLVCGSSTIVLEPNQIIINSPLVKINS